ncbi:ECF transporter S component [Metabacillus arenae]|uniref:Riboflavin transporter n=1 Tax=Metabacillus arenae TaxID=2771434 RepID=A0A926RVN6_9BACI|nr:ECF transporter S component [Metabacillus arenae]MBD1378650.1 ECF transporter S component [Metabacillus arenae]
MKKSKLTKQLAVGMLSSIAYLLMMLDFPFPGFPPFLQIDFSEVPAIVAAIVFGPIAGIIVEAIKNILHYLIQGSATGMPVGQLANFVAGTLFILPVSYMFRKLNNTKGIVIGLIFGTVIMAIIMSILNYYVILPAYTIFLNSPALSGPETKQLIVSGILPFNFIKGIIVSFVFVAIFMKLKVWLFNQLKYQSA